MIPERAHILDDLLISNRPPSPQECASAQSLVRLCGEELSFVESHIANLQKQLDELMSQRSAIQTNRRKYLDVLSARRRLPPEIIASFIQIAAASSYDDDPSETHQESRQARYDSVLPFMLVSKEWYETACGFAHFWTELKLDLAKGSREEIPYVLESASKRAQRASELPLSLIIKLSSSNPCNDKLIDFVRSISPRIGSLTFAMEVDYDLDLGVLTGLFRDSLSPGAVIWPKLHTLEVVMRSDVTFFIDPVPRDTFSDFQKFPALRSAEIVGPQGIFSVFDIPWSSLWTLRLGSSITCDVGDYFSILGQCTNLRSLNLCIRGQPERYSTRNLFAITLPHLTHLHFEYTQCNELFIVMLLAWLELPSLHSLAYIPVDGSHTSIIRSLTQLFQRSGCQESLRYLELNLGLGLGQAAVDLRSLFRETPSLSGLKISGHRLHAGCLSSIPDSVKELAVELTFPVIDDARTSFIEFLRSRNRCSSLSTPMKARLDIVDSADTALVREKLEVLNEQLGSTLDVVMG